MERGGGRREANWKPAGGSPLVRRERQYKSARCSAFPQSGPDMERWSGRVALVTGASSGVGAHVSELLVRAGMKVVGLARRLERLQELARRLGPAFHPLQCDLRDEQQILAAFAFVDSGLGPLHVLVNSAGCLVHEPITEGSSDNFRRILDVNVLAVAICIREGVRLMRKHAVRGHIVTINSLAGHNAPMIKSPLSLYCASKYAVTGLTESVRNELHALRSGIKITSISPGAVRTDMILAAGVPEELLQRMRVLETKDVAEAVIYALSTPPHVQVNELTITPLDESVQQERVTTATP